MTQYLRVRNWDTFQHYKDRNPPWIKLHRHLLHDYEFSCLQDASKLQLMLIWLLASQTDNKIPANPDWIKSQLNIKGKVCLKELIDKGFLEDESGSLASRKQVADLETETEAYREETEAYAEWLPVDEWNEYKKFRVSIKAKMTPHAEKLAIRDLDKLRQEGHSPIEVINQSIKRNWKGFFPIKGDDNGTRKQSGAQHGGQTKDDRAKAAILRGLGMSAQ